MHNAAYEIHVLILYPNLNFDQIEQTLAHFGEKYDII